MGQKLQLAWNAANANRAARAAQLARVEIEARALEATVTVWAPMASDPEGYEANHANMVDYRLQQIENALRGWGQGA